MNVSLSGGYYLTDMSVTLAGEERGNDYSKINFH